MNNKLNMLYKLRKLTLVLSMLVCSLGFLAGAHAQTATASGGYIGLSLNPPTVGQLVQTGVGLAFGPNQQFLNGYYAFAVNGGFINLPTSQGEIGTEGGLVFGNSKSQWSIRRLALDTTGPVATLTGLLIVDGVQLGRQPIFDLQIPTPLPSQTVGTMVFNSIPLTLHGAVRDQLNKSFGTSLPAGATDAYLFVQVVLVDDQGPQ